MSRDVYADRLRCDAVSHDNELARARPDRRGNVEVRRDNFATGRDAHRAVVVRTGVVDLAAAVVGDAHERVVRRVLVLVAERYGLAQPVELRSADLIGLTRADARRSCLDG